MATSWPMTLTTLFRWVRRFVDQLEHAQGHRRERGGLGAVGAEVIEQARGERVDVGGSGRGGSGGERRGRREWERVGAGEDQGGLVEDRADRGGAGGEEAAQPGDLSEGGDEREIGGG